MLKLFQLTKRNASLYFRDRMAVFSSLLSMIIIIGLMLIFLGDMYIDGLNEIFESIPDAGNKTKDAKLLVLSWTTAGIIPINAVMVTLSSLTSMISDKTSGKINSIYTAPISRTVISASYIASAWITSVIVCILTLAISEIYFFAKGMEVFSAAVHLELFGMIAVNSFTYSAVMYLLAALIKSEMGSYWNSHRNSCRLPRRSLSSYRTIFRRDRFASEMYSYYLQYRNVPTSHDGQSYR